MGVNIDKLSRSLGFRVFAIAAVGFLLAGAVAAISFSVTFIAQSERELTNKARAMAKVVGQQLVAPLEFDALLDQTALSDDGTAILKSLKADNDFRYGVVKRTNGTLFAKLGKAPTGLEKKLPQNGTIWNEQQHRQLHLRIDIKKGSKPLGVLYVGFSAKQIVARIDRIIKIVVVLTTVISLVFISAVFILIIRSVIDPVGKITDVLQKVGEGDMRDINQLVLGTNTTELVTMYQALVKTTNAFRNHITAIATVATQLNKTADGILQNSTSLQVSANEQAAAVGETTVTIEEVEKTGHATAQNAKNIQDDSNHTLQISNEGQKAVGETRTQLQNLQSQVEGIVASSVQLHEELTEVDRIIAQVGGVTQQSHTLSINASIEAVKAGKKGRGFAVVANRIRDLSQESRLATDQVRKTLMGIKDAIGQIVVTNEEGLSMAKAGFASMERTSTLISQLGQSIESATNAATSIAHNTYQQAIGLEQTARAMNEINRSAQENLTAIDQLHQFGEELKDHAVALQALMDMFKL